MKIDSGKPEKYTFNGREILAITEFKLPYYGYTHALHLTNGETFTIDQDKLDPRVKERAVEKWKRIRFHEDEIVSDFRETYSSLDLLRINSEFFTHGINLETLEVVKL